MKIVEKRKNGKGSAVFLGKGRYLPWASRICIGKDINGTSIYYDIATFETELEALVCLENYHKELTPLKIKKEKFDRIATFSKRNYPLVPVTNSNSTIQRKNKRNYTFKQVFEEMKSLKFPTKEEIKLEKEKHLKPERKICLSQLNEYEHSF